MVKKPEDENRSGNTCQRATAGDKDRTIAELKDRIDILEEELRQKRSAVPGSGAEDTPEKGKERYHAIVDSQTEMITRFTPDYRLTFVNEAVLRYSGLKREQMIGHSFFEFLTPDQHDKVRALVAALDSASPAITVENYAIMPDGETRWQQWVNTAIADDDGRITEIQSVGRDITERKRAEVALLGNERFLNNVFDSIKDGISVLDRDLNIVRVNETMEAWHPDARPLAGRKCYSAYHGRSEPCPWCPSRVAMKKKAPCSRIVPHDIAGRTVGWREVHSFPMLDNGGNVTGVIDYVRDITERKLAEETIIADLKDTQLLRDLSARLISEGDINVLYHEIMDAAIALMGSDCASLQMFYPERGKDGELHMLACRGFTPEAAKFWELVHTGSHSSCGIALSSGRRVIVEDVEKSELMEGTQDQAMYRQTGIRAVQSTPLFSRSGRLVGMISTHWRNPHQPTERELRFIDLLARQAADLIERRQTEEALRQSEEKYRELVENANSIILRWDIDGRITFFNEYAREFFGYSTDEIIGKDVNILVPPTETTGRDLTTLIDDIRRYPERFIKNINENVRKNGERAWITWTNRSIHDRQGNFTGIMAIGHDITEQRRTEEALRESEERYRAFYESSIDAILITTPDGGIEAANKAACQMFGYTEEELIRLGRYAVVDPEDPRIVHAIEERRRTGRFRGELNFRKKDGTVIPVDDSNVVFTDRNGKQKTVMILRDITERKRFEEAITEARDYYLKLFEDFPSPIWRSDAAGKCNYLNRSWYEFTGKSPEQELGYGWMEGIHPDDAPRVTAECETAFRTQQPFVIEFRLRHRDGTYRSIIDYGKPLFGLKGEFGGYIGSCYDITERKQAEEAMMEAKLRAELYLDLMGHDINNMHQIALGYLEIAEGMTGQDDFRREFLEKPIEVLRRSSRLISNVRKMQKLIDGSLHDEDVDILEVLETVKREFGSVPQKPVTLHLNGTGPCLVRANELVYDIFSNLVTNAIKHTGQTADIGITLEEMYDGDRRCYLVSVADNGPGIPDHFKGVIFNRLLKGTNKAKGMGLGLYLVKSLAESYDGHVWVEDRVPGDHTQGARFVVMLPVAGE